jgi:hypothetical protein
MAANPTLAELRQQEYQQRVKVERLRRLVFAQPDPTADAALSDDLRAAEADLVQIAQARAAQETGGTLLDTRTDSALLGAKTTGLEVVVQQHMIQAPTAIYHLLDPQDSPLIKCMVTNMGQAPSAGGGTGIRRVRVTSFLEGYSAQAIQTVELEPKGSPKNTQEFPQLPPLFPERAQTVTELTRVALHLQVDDLDTGRIEIQATYPVWLLARTTAPLAVYNPATKRWHDLTRYLGAFVTPNTPAILGLLSDAAGRHPRKELVGYQLGPNEVEPQVRALFEAVKAVGLNYVQSVIAFGPDHGMSNQRVRLPRETLAWRTANCIDGVVLFASLLEAISLSPALVIIPGHAFVGWQTGEDKPGQPSNPWRYLETTLIGSATFEKACTSAECQAAKYQAQKVALNDEAQFRQWRLPELRSQYGITPME